MIFGATVGQPSTGACYVKATFVLIPRNMSAECSLSDKEMEFSHHICIRGTRYGSLFKINDVVCGLISSFCSAFIVILNLLITEELILPSLVKLKKC